MFHTMNFARKVAGVAATLLLLGCQTYTPEQLAELMDLGSRPVSCTTTDDCNTKWSKGISWILTNSAYAIQTQSETLVTTYPGQGYSGYSLQRVAEGNGAFRIDLKVLCAATPGLGFDGKLYVSCVPSEIEAKAHFYNAVMVQ